MTAESRRHVLIRGADGRLYSVDEHGCRPTRENTEKLATGDACFRPVSSVAKAKDYDAGRMVIEAGDHGAGRMVIEADDHDAGRMVIEADDYDAGRMVIEADSHDAGRMVIEARR